ncbi:MAG: YceD family protein [Tepidanaerobacteraceae bacterium]
MKLNLAKIKQLVGSILEYEFQIETLDIGINLDGVNTIGPVKVKGHLENLGDRIFQVEGRIELEATALCSRCLDETESKLTIDFSFKLTDMITDCDDEDIITFNGEYIDLYPQVINEIILNWPGQILCKTDCRGLCPNCGSNMNYSVCKCDSYNIDPRLAKLKEFLRSE